MPETTIDEALERLATTGPERQGWLSNHGPMACEVLVRHGCGVEVDAWLDSYQESLEEPPRGVQPIETDAWREPLGDPVRAGDWIRFFERELALDDWRRVVSVWWPRLLPGVAAGATHGVIRTGHALRSLGDAETPQRVQELALALAYWAARWQPLALPGRGPYGAGDPRAALDRLALVTSQHGGVRTRLAQLAGTSDWDRDLVPPGAHDESPSVRLGHLVDAAVLRFFAHGHAEPVMMVHSATAPNAVLLALPHLPSSLHADNLRAAWAASAAISAAYASPSPRARARAGSSGADALMALAVRSADAHAIKFADTALDAFTRTGRTEILHELGAATTRIAED